MGKKLTVFLIDGADNGPRTIEIGNWSGKAINTPRSQLTKLIERDEYDKPGVYVLKAIPQKDIYSERIYIGEAENLKTRLKQHLKDSDKDFGECLIFISKDELLTKSHVKYIESRLIELTKVAKNAELDNSTSPSKPSLSEADISDMEYFINQIKLILPTAGYSFLIPTTSQSIESQKPEDEKSIVETSFDIKTQSLSATMVETEDGFVVIRGSQANLNTSKSIAKGWLQLREKLLDNGNLVRNGDHLQFTENVVFSSPSAASSVVLGRQSAGPLEWIRFDGKSLKDLESE